MFKKLENHEVMGTDKLSEWDKLEAMLPKKRKKRIVWFWFALTLLILGFIKMDSNTSFKGKNDIALNNSIKNEMVHSGQNLLALKLEDNPSDLGTINLENTIDQINRIDLNLVKTRVSSINLDPQPKKVKSLSMNSSVELLKNNTAQLRIDSASKISQLDYLSSSKLFLLPVDYIISNPISFLHPEINSMKSQGSFSIFGGVRASIMNQLGNSSILQPSYTAGVLIQVNYETSKFIGLSLKCGFQSEYNHDLNYSYISDKEIFFQKSEKETKINLKKLSSVNFQLSALMNWGPKHVSSVGVYMSYVIQSGSNVSIVGSGKYNGIKEQNFGQKNYHSLLSPSDIGLYLAQSYRVHPSWLISLEFFVGINNRLNDSYFNTQSIKRKEISLSILKKI